jgi:radical SAM protein with 4Fe4S-binding SPASM domain
VLNVELQGLANQMTKYSRYVKINHGNQDTLACTVQGIHLPMDASEDTLSRNSMLAGQEATALRNKLFKSDVAKITIIPTWGCNLRCRHCVVIDKLERGSDSDLNCEQLVTFLEKFSVNAKLKRACFVGGEPLLRPDILLKLTKALTGWMFSMTTNLSIPFTETHYELFDHISSITVSVDGLPKNHNRQRIPLNKDPDIFGKTVDNIKQLVRRGLKDKLSVQGAVDQVNKDDEIAYKHFFCNLGLNPLAIFYGLIHPHPRGESPTGFIEALKQMPINYRPCCKYQPGMQCTILPDNSIVSDFYTQTPIGTIFDEPAAVIENHRRLVLNTMPVLNDPTCRECDVIGLCWGHCSNGEPVTGMLPSKYCDQAGLRTRVHNLALAGSLVVQGSPACSP